MSMRHNNNTNRTTGQTRRTILKVAAASGITGLAGCLSTGDDSEEPMRPIEVEEVPTDHYTDSLNVWNWYQEWVEWGTEGFEEEYPDVSTTIESYSQPSQWYSQLQAGDHSIDHVGALTNSIGRGLEGGREFYEPLPVEKIPNFENIDQQWIDPIEEYFSADEGGLYSVPHSVSVHPALVYNTNYFDSPPDSWDVLWDEQFAGEMAPFYNFPAIASQTAALYLGQDPINPSNYDEIQTALEEQTELLHYIGTNSEAHMQSFINEEIILGTHLSGRINIAKYVHNADYLEWTVPEEGSLFHLDHIVIPTGAPNPLTSLNFLNYMLSRDSFEAFLRILPYKIPMVDIESLRGAEGISDELIDDIQWSDDLIDRLQFSPPLDQDVNEEYDRIWSEVRAG